MAKGSCLCGALKYEVDGPVTMMSHCHCSMCRKHHGALFATFIATPAKQFRWIAGESDVKTYPSSASGKRAFCGTCGSAAPIVMPEFDMAFVPAGPLEGDIGAKPQCHIFTSSRAVWYEITDSLPQYEKYPPGFDSAEVARPAVPAKPGFTLGSCLCGEVAFEIEGAPLRAMNCHCSRCRRARSAAHASNAFYPLGRFRWTRGGGQVADYKLTEARYFGTAFCRHCGGELPRVSIERDLVVVPYGSLDTDPGLRPTAHIFVGSKADWFDITDSLPRFEEMPPVG